MILRYYHGNIAYFKISELCNENKRGVQAYALLKAGEELGFYARGYKGKLEEIPVNKLPVILHTTINTTYHHYILLYEIQKDYAIVADPASKIKKIKKSELKKIYNEIYFVLIPQKLLPNEKRSLSLKTLYHSLWKLYKKEILILTFFTFCVIFCTVCTSYAFEVFLTTYQTPYFFHIFILFFFLILMKSFFSFLKNKIMITFDRKLDFKLTTEAYEKILKLPYSYYHNHTSGEMTSRVQDIFLIKQMLQKITFQGFFCLFLFLILFLLLCMIHFTFSMITFVMLIFYFLLIFFLTKKSRSNIRKYQIKKEEILEILFEGVKNYETIQGLHLKEKYHLYFKEKYQEYLMFVQKHEQAMNRIYIIKDFFFSFSELLILFFYFLYFQRNFAFPTFITYFFLYRYIIDFVGQTLDVFYDYQEGREAFDRLTAILFEEKESGFLEKQMKGDILVSNLSFSYFEGEPILQNVSLKISAGEKVMIFGRSGYGKSTLFALLMRYYKVPRGHIFIDQVDLCDYTTACLEENIVLLSQKESLFTMTLYQNLKAFQEKKGKRIVKVSKDCLLEEVLEKLSFGYHTPLEEDGSNLSGGQRQRVILARTFLKKANIILIDEGFSQIDKEREREILKNIFYTMKQKTILVISHRKENADLYDRVITL